MGVFNDILKADQTLIRNQAALDFEFVPKVLPKRENEQRQLIMCIKPLLAGHNGRNLLIYGAPGIGKTAVTRHVLRDLEEESEDAYVIYINCWQNNSTYKILVEMCDILGYKFVQNKKTTELFKIVEGIINKKSAVFVFDEIDKVENNDYDFLYFVLEQIYKRSVFLITNFKAWYLNLDERIRSRLMPEMVEFRQYSLPETKHILEDRITIAFYPGVWERAATEKIVQKTAEIKDIRSGIHLMRESALQAEEKSSKKILPEHVDAAITKLADFTIKKSTDLEDETKFILSIVKQNSGKKIGDLHKLYAEQGGKMSYKTFQRRIAELEKGSYISLEKSTGKGGNTTIVNKKLTDY